MKPLGNVVRRIRVLLWGGLSALIGFTASVYASSTHTIDVPGFTIHLGANPALSQGREALLVGDDLKALRYYELALTHDLTDRQLSRAHNGICVARIMQARWGKALEACNQAIKINPRNWRFFNNRGNVYLETGRIEDAYQEYKHALKFAPKSKTLKRNIDITRLRAQQADIGLPDAGPTEIDDKSYSSRRQDTPSLHATSTKVGKPMQCIIFSRLFGNAKEKKSPVWLGCDQMLTEVPRIKKPLASALLVASLFITACTTAETSPKSDQLTVEVGTRAHIKRQGQDLLAEVVAVRDDYVTTAFEWQGEIVAKRRYFRGLYPVSGDELDYQFKLDFDEAALQQLFPLAVGNESRFGGNLKILNGGQDVKVTIYIQVLKQKTIKLPSGAQDVFVIDIFTQHRGQNEIRSKYNTVYYSPELAMVLKSVMHEESGQSYWRVVGIEKPNSERDRALQNIPRRSGTVLI